MRGEEVGVGVCRCRSVLVAQLGTVATMLAFEEGHHNRLQAGLVGQVHAAGPNYFGAILPGHVKGLERITGWRGGGAGKEGNDGDEDEVGGREGRGEALTKTQMMAKQASTLKQ